MEIEDYFVMLCEVMCYFIVGDDVVVVCVEEQCVFFQCYLVLWVDIVCDVVLQYLCVVFYVDVVGLVKVFFDVEWFVLELV